MVAHHWWGLILMELFRITTMEASANWEVRLLTNSSFLFKTNFCHKITVLANIPHVAFNICLFFQTRAHWWDRLSLYVTTAGPSSRPFGFKLHLKRFWDPVCCCLLFVYVVNILILTISCCKNITRQISPRWGLMTITTVGYDLSPKTFLGFYLILEKSHIPFVFM